MNEINSPSRADARDWYYRMGERERGPLTLAQLKDLVASSGEVAREIVVRHGADGEWVPYQSIDGATARRLHADRSIRPASAPAAALADSPPPGDDVGTASPVLKRDPNLGRRLHANWPVVAGVLVWGGVNLILWYVLDPFRRTENRYFRILTKAAQKARDAQALDASARGRMAASVVEEIKPIVEDLQKSANASEPVRQHLLWAGKDQLPGLFSASGKERAECEGIFQRHMYEAGRRLGIDVPLPATQVAFQ
jgi:hypothetical protein